MSDSEVSEVSEVVSVGEPSHVPPLADEPAFDAVLAKVVSAFAGTVSAMGEEASLPSGVFRDMAFLTCCHALIANPNVKEFEPMIQLAGTMAGKMTALKESMERVDREKRQSG